jgi:sarcosine oxidase
VADYDVIIAGLGAMGSAAAYHLAKANCRVLGLDRFQPPHQMGSSHGATRIIREAYFENPAYVPLVRRAYQLWSALEQESGHRLLVQTGGLMLGELAGTLIRGAKRSAEEHRLSYRLLSHADLRREFPMFQPSSRMVAIWEPRAGILFPELAIQAHLELAAKYGAHLRYNEQILDWQPLNHGVLVRTVAGTYTAKKMLLAVGAWTKSLLPDLALPLSVERQVQFWFAPQSETESFQPHRCPIFICEYAAQRYFYGFPDLGDGVKAALHHEGSVASPDLLDREAKDHEVEKVGSLLRELLPGAAGNLRSAAVCLYTNTPDEHFLFDRHPNHEQVLIASPCSGHGFKFSSVVGELAAKILCGGKPQFDLSLFKIARFG